MRPKKRGVEFSISLSLFRSRFHVRSMFMVYIVKKQKNKKTPNPKLMVIRRYSTSKCLGKLFYTDLLSWTDSIQQGTLKFFSCTALLNLSPCIKHET